MSSFVPTSTITDSFPTISAPSDDPGDGGPGMARGANYFFGFLITFVVLLLVFVGCGIGSRRRYQARRQAMLLDTLEPWAPTAVGGEYRLPTLYEKQMVLGEDEWSSIQPLSVDVIRSPEVVADQRQSTRGSHSPSPPASERGLFHHQHPISHWLPSFLSTPRGRRQDKVPVNDEEKQVEIVLPEAVQVAVMVLMPSPHDNRGVPYHRTNCDGIEKLPEYQIGVVRVPWYMEVPSSEHPPTPTPPPSV